MAVRKRLRHDQRTRDQIQTTQLLKRLISHVHGECEMTATQVRAAEIVLKKSLPDLQATQISGDADNPVHNVTTVKTEKTTDFLADFATKAEADQDQVKH